MSRRSAAAAGGIVALAVAVVTLFALRTEAPIASPSPMVAQTASPPATTPAPSPTATPLPRSSPPATPAATPQATSTPQPGAITGRFGYGSEFIPPVTVYAISTTDPRVWYSVDYAGLAPSSRATAPPGTPPFDTYTLTGVAAGSYWVVAYRNDQPGQGPDPGFHSRQVECFRTRPSGPCPDINLAPVTVTAGQTARGIDVITWGIVPPPSPSPPATHASLAPVAKVIRIQVDRVEADLAAQRLVAEGIPAQVVSDSDMLAVAGTPMRFSIVVPSHLEASARKVLAEVEKPRKKRR